MDEKKYTLGMSREVYDELPAKIKEKAAVSREEDGIVNVDVKEEDTIKSIICFCFQNRIEGATELLESFSMEVK